MQRDLTLLPPTTNPSTPRSQPNRICVLLLAGVLAGACIALILSSNSSQSNRSPTPVDGTILSPHVLKYLSSSPPEIASSASSSRRTSDQSARSSSVFVEPVLRPKTKKQLQEEIARIPRWTPGSSRQEKSPSIPDRSPNAGPNLNSDSSPVLRKSRAEEGSDSGTSPSPVLRKSRAVKEQVQDASMIAKYLDQLSIALGGGYSAKSPPSTPDTNSNAETATSMRGAGEDADSIEEKGQTQGAGIGKGTKVSRSGKKLLKELFMRNNVLYNASSPSSVSSVVSRGSGNFSSRHMPLHYHSQIYRPPDFSPFIPSYASIHERMQLQTQSDRSLTLPDMTRQRGEFEKENLKLHLCNGVFEAYSASYLTTRAHMLHVNSEGYNLSWVNCEMASFIHMKESNKFYKNPQNHGAIMQSLDVLDFSVIHLSAYERSTHRYRDKLFKSREEMKANWHNIDPIIAVGRALEELNNPKRPGQRRNITYSAEALRTVVVMPFLGGAMGAGHSKLNNRFEYLKTCFWSFYEFIPHIVMGVSRQEDVDWGWKESGLPFYDIIRIDNLPKSAGLPVGTTQQIKKRLADGRYAHFDYVFFTESDQILISRELPLMYEHLKRYPGHMMLPHRLMPYSPRITSELHLRPLSSVPENEWMDKSCCLPRQNCVERKKWVHIKDPSVPFLNYYGIYVPLGNVNFLDEKYRACVYSDRVDEFCL